MVAFIKPRFTPPQKGRIVITSDDGRIEDYTHWMPLIQRTMYEHNQFKARKGAIFSPATNTGYIEQGKNRPGYITMASWEQIEEMHKNGVEFTSHGKYHVYLEFIPITQPAVAGVTKIYYTTAWYKVKEGFRYFIREGTTEEYFTVLSVNRSNTGNHYTGDHHIEIDTPLVNSYTTNAKIHLAPESIRENFQGVIDDFAARDIVCAHHINPWYNQSPVTRPLLEEYFESSSIWNTGGNFPVSSADVYMLSRTNDISTLSTAIIDTHLQETIDNDTLLVVQGHGGIDAKTLSNLEYLIRNALQRGIKIVSMSEGVEYLKKRKAGLI